MTADPPSAPVWTTFSARRRWGLLAILFLVSLSNYVDRQVMSVLIEPIKAEFRVSDAMMGVLNGFAFAAFYAVLGIPIARAADRGNRRAIIGVSLLVWSVMSTLCGMARNFPQLALARFGVGIGEAGAIPPIQSLIVDYFPPAQRSRAFAIFVISASAGYLIAFVAGAQIAAHYGWRAAFVVPGLPGLLLAALAWLGLDEPRLRPGGGGGTGVQEPLMTTWRALAAKRSYVAIIAAMILYYLVAYGVVTWFPAYLGRVLKLKLVDIGVEFGLVSAVAAMAGAIGGGWLNDRLAHHDRRWLARTPGLLMCLALPCYELALFAHSFAGFMAMSMLGGMCLNAALPAVFTVIHTVCGSARRAMAIAICLFFANLFGLGFGPVMTGWLSDRFSAVYGAEGLRQALMIALVLLLPAGATLWRAGATLEQEFEA